MQAFSHPSYPVVVDLDGTLTPTDTLVESVLLAVRSQPLNLLKLPFWLVQGRAAFKQRVSEHAQIEAHQLPYRPALLDWLRKQKAAGRKLVLATAAHRSIAEKVNAHLGLFDHCMASDGCMNLKGTHKLKAIQDEVGPAFAYAGDSAADLPIWQQASSAIVVGASASTHTALQRQATPLEERFDNDQVSMVDWIKAIRLHQWVKNLLLLVPMLTAFSFSDASRLMAVLLGVTAFSLAASATYIANDLWDLPSDRAHPRKRHRPFASGRISILKGIMVAIGLMGAGMLIATAVSLPFLGILAAYVVVTTAYSWWLKEYVLLDVLMLAMLYTLRIIAGGVATGIVVSSWLLAFSVFIFLSLALIKRCAELVSMEQEGRIATRGRDYRVGDLTVLWPLGVGAGLASVLVFGLFISSPDTASRYPVPQLLWLVALLLVYWLGRLWIKTARGEMHDDPIVFALKDRGSRITITAMVAVPVLAHFPLR